MAATPWRASRRRSGDNMWPFDCMDADRARAVRRLTVHGIDEVSKGLDNLCVGSGGMTIIDCIAASASLGVGTSHVPRF